MTTVPKAEVFRRKPTYLEVLNLIEADADKVTLPERTGVEFWDSFAMGQYREMLQQTSAGDSRVAEHQAMDAAMTQAATEQDGVTKAELLHFMRDMNAQNTNAHATLAASLNENIQAQQRRNDQQATAIAEEMAMHSRRQDARDAVTEQVRQSLAQAHRTPASVPIPAAPSTQEVHNHYHTHQASLQAAVPQASGADPALLQLLGRAQEASENRANQQQSIVNQLGGYLGSAIRHMQSNGVGVAQILEHVAQHRQSVADAPASSSNQPPPPPPPGAGAVAIAEQSSGKKKKLVLTPDEALDRLLAKHDRKKARQAERAAGRSAPYAAPDIPRPPPLAIQDRRPEPAPTIVRRGQKRPSGKQLQKGTKRPQPKVVERFDISDQTDHLPPGADQSDHLPPGADHEPPPVAIDRGAVTTLAKHMAANRRRPTRAAEPSTAVAVRATTEQESAQALAKKVKKAVKSGTRVRKELKGKAPKVGRSAVEPKVGLV